MTSADSNAPDSRARRSEFRVKEDAPGARERAESSVAAAFTRLMRATTSPRGELTDPALIAAATGVLVFVGLVVRAMTGWPSNMGLVFLLGALPVAVGVAYVLVLRGARARVVAWLAKLPFAVGNMNALLNGIGGRLRVRFSGPLPTREVLNALLDPIHPDCFTLEFSDDEPVVELHIGVFDSKWNPARSNHRRYARVQAILERALVPLSLDHPIVDVWIV
ncbi:MAG: hypothetical protein HY908_34480 [Myxococcales bacterium]|nr:hypothetical protein [Myxococcales bacterium]